MLTLTDIYNKIGERKRISDKLYLTLKKAIITGLILPLEKIDEYQLSETLYVSKASIKEAIKMLSMDRYIILDEKKGYIINKITLSDIIEIHEFLNFLSIATIETMAMNYDVYSLILNESLNNFDHKSNNNMDKQFHMTMAICTNNNNIISSTSDAFDRLFWGKKTLKLHQVQVTTLNDHKEIVGYMTNNKNFKIDVLKDMINDHFSTHLNECIT
ncbi:MAG: GntR family transcriptional regulator [Eubacteriales bacterium]